MPQRVRLPGESAGRAISVHPATGVLAAEMASTFVNERSRKRPPRRHQARGAQRSRGNCYAELPAGFGRSRQPGLHRNPATPGNRDAVCEREANLATPGRFVGDDTRISEAHASHGHTRRRGKQDSRPRTRAIAIRVIDACSARLLGGDGAGEPARQDDDGAAAGRRPAIHAARISVCRLLSGS
jgi:hypothetical protein